VWQFHYLLPEFTALENVAMPLLLRGRPWPSVQDEATRWLHEVGLESRGHHRSGELSGGEQQRWLWPGRSFLSRSFCWRMSPPEISMGARPSRFRIDRSITSRLPADLPHRYPQSRLCTALSSGSAVASRTRGRSGAGVAAGMSEYRTSMGARGTGQFFRQEQILDRKSEPSAMALECHS